MKNIFHFFKKKFEIMKIVEDLNLSNMFDKLSLVDTATKALDGDSKSQYKIASAYEEIDNTINNIINNTIFSFYFFNRMKWLIKAADLGLVNAQYDLGMLYDSNEREKKKTFFYLKKAAEQGHIDAIYDIGQIYFEKENYKAAYDWGMRSCETGNSKAKYMIGNMFFLGLGVRQDVKKAIVLFEESAEQGYVLAQYNLGNMHVNGKHIIKDTKRAKEYYGAACDNGYQPGCVRYREVNEEGY